MKLNFWLVIVLTALVMITGCSGKRVFTAAYGVQKLPDGSLSDKQIRKSLLKEFKRWNGTPHVMGGNSTKGVDCSGFVYQVYNSVFKLKIPRSTQLLMNAGKRIKKSSLRPGDLVAFKPPSYPRHVGIYVGANKFIHTSKSRGVTMTSLNNPYWKKCYYSSRRLFVR